MDGIAVNLEFWNGKKVLVTGHTGFKGSWMSAWLTRLGADVTGLALAPDSDPSLFDDAHVATGMNSVIGDIRDASLVQRLIADSSIEIVLHLAAQALVRESYDDPIETFSTNVVGTATVLDACRRSDSVKSVVSVTSDKCYENREWVWGYRESEAMGGHDPYSASKGCAELVTASMRRSFFEAGSSGSREIGLGSGRAGNVIGGGDWSANRIIPDIVRAFGVGEKVEIRSPNAIRPWQHVLEPVRGYMMLAERLYDEPAGIWADGWNFGPHDIDARPVRSIVESMCAAWGGTADYRVNEGGPHEANYLKLDCSKSRDVLGWKPALGLDDALTWIVEWHKAHLDGESAKSLLDEQLARYEALLAD